MLRYALGVVVVVLMGGAVVNAEEKPVLTFRPLYNGKDLTNWSVHNGKTEAWAATGELLSCVAEGGGWLRSTALYSDFILKLEYRLPAGGNSGVGLRLPAEGQPHINGMEIQILDDDAPQYKELKPAQYTGSIYYQSAAKRGAPKPPGEWNSYEITCVGQKVKVVLNGQTVTEADLSTFTKGEGDHPPLAERPQVGFIGLQSHGSRVDFRKIELHDMTTRTESGLIMYDLKVGTGELVPAGATVRTHYTGWLDTGKKFDSSRDRGEPISFPLSAVIKGWGEGIPGMKVGGRRKLVIPPHLGYGAKGVGPIPANSTLVFDVEVLGLE